MREEDNVPKGCFSALVILIGLAGAGGALFFDDSPRRIASFILMCAAILWIALAPTNRID